MIKFATVRTIVLLTVIWALLCYGTGYALNPNSMGVFSRPSTENVASRTAPHVTLWMNHLCCSGCVDDVTKALGGISWITDLKMGAAVGTPEENDQKAMEGSQAISESRNRIDFDVKDANQIEFMVIARALRDAGLVADKIELSGVEHYRVEAGFKHVCCKQCADSLDSGINSMQLLKATGQLPWIDSVVTNKVRKTLTAHARYGAMADMVEFIGALNRLGFEPDALKVLVGSET